MKLLMKCVLFVLVFLAVSSGVTKVLLMKQDVDFFGQYGFTNLTLIIYGICQLLGGVLLSLPKTRIIGAVVVAVTFMISAIILFMANSLALMLVTLLCVVLLGLVIKQSLNV